MANKQRIEYIDWLKGLSIICVVWFHLPHPEWLDFSFRMPLFFLLSGIFFKTVPFRTYCARKTRQLLIPFIFFYLFYFGYMFLEYRYSPTHPDQELTGEMFWDLFNTHSGFTNQLVNPPLWFICALINLQLLLYLLVRTLRRRTLIMCAALCISAAGILWVEQTPTYLMFGRSLRYLGYYTFGHLYGKQLLGWIEHSSRYRLRILAVCTLAMGIALYHAIMQELPGHEVGCYLFNAALVVALIILFRYVSRVPALRFFHFFGRNSYAVLGLHYIIVQWCYIYLFMAGLNLEPVHGLWMLPLTLGLLVPVIRLMNRYTPELVGKQRLRPAAVQA